MELFIQFSSILTIHKIFKDTQKKKKLKNKFEIWMVYKKSKKGKNILKIIPDTDNYINNWMKCQVSAVICFWFVIK